MGTNYTYEKSEKQPPKQKSEKHFRLIPLKINGNLLFFKCITFLN